jgi:hypothetical protein
MEELRQSKQAVNLDFGLGTLLPDPASELRAAEATVDPDLPQPGMQMENRFEQLFGSFALRATGGHAEELAARTMCRIPHG